MIKLLVIPFGSLLSLLTGCGNNWANNSARDQSPTALQSKGIYYYDKGEFEKADTIFQTLLAKDPENVDARIYSAYTLNALAGLSVLDLVAKLSGVLKTTGKLVGSGELADTPSSNTGVLRYISILGLSDIERADLTQRLASDSGVKDKSNPDFSQLLSHSKKLSYFNSSWSTACKLLPSSTLSILWGKALSSEKLQNAVTAESCKSGLPEGKEVKTAALFALTMSALAQASALYQLIVDSNGDGTVDLVAAATLVSTNITTLNASAGSVSTNPTKAIESINSYISELQSIAAKVQSTTMDVTLFQFNLLANLSVLLGASNQIKDTISKAIASFDAARDKIKEYTSAAGNDNKIKASVNKAAETVDKIFAAAAGDPAKLEELNKKKTSVCTNFETLKSTYNLPADTQKPNSCT